MAVKKQPLLYLSAWQLLQAMQDGVITGRNPRLLHSEKHDRAFYSRMWSSIRANGSWQGEIWNRRKNGAVYPEWLTISAIKDPWGHTRCYLGVFRDITSPKIDEERLKHLAQFDPLTGLPNRRLFSERLHRALAGRRPLAVFFWIWTASRTLTTGWATPRAISTFKRWERGGDGVRFWTRAVSLQRTSATLSREGAAKAAQPDRNTPRARTVRGP